MKPLLVTAAAVFAFYSITTAGAGLQGQAARPSTARATAAAPAPDAAFLKQYCVTCHNDRVKAGALTLASLDVAAVDGHADVWEKVVRKLRTGMMPPDGVPKPPAEAAHRFTSALEASLDRAAARRLDPGTPALHRLNRTEYANAIRDLLALDVDVAALLPPDDSAAGFDNIADVLGVSPALIEGYAAAAASISRRAIGSPTIGLDRKTYRMPGDVSQDAHVDASRGTARRRPLRDARRRARHAARARRHANEGECRPAHDCGSERRAQPRRRRRRRLSRRDAHAGHHAGDHRRSVQSHGCWRHT
jgi:cytochrome c551/c552